MIVALSLLIVGLMSAAVIGSHLEKAPEGFEDQTGFHFINRGSGVGGVAGTASLVAPDKHAAAVSLS